MRFQLFGVRVFISLPFTALLSAMILLDRTGLLSAAFFAAVIHECAHLFTMLICGVKPRAVRFCVCAVEIVRSTCEIRRWKGMLISLSGPLMNLILGLLFLAITPDDAHGWLYDFAHVQLTMGGFNLLPVPGLDGGTVVEMLSGSRRMAVLTAIFAVGVLLLWQCFCGPLSIGGIGMFLSVIYIFAMQLLCTRTG